MIAHNQRLAEWNGDIVAFTTYVTEVIEIKQNQNAFGLKIKSIN